MKLNAQEAYVALGIPYGSNEADSRKAYRRLISAWHPDRNSSPEAHAQTLRLNAAIMALERLGFAVEQTVVDHSFHFADDFSDYDYAEQRRDSRFYYEETVKSARSITRKVKLSIEEAAFGSIHSLKGKTSNVCRACNGRKHNGEEVRCRECGGSGQVNSRASYWSRRVCTDCGGQGFFYKPCPACRGTGQIAGMDYAFKINIPPGARDGNVLLARGVGGMGSDGKTRADAKIKIEIKPHDLFYFDENDGTLCVEYPVLMTELLRKETVMVPTLYGPQPLPLTAATRQTHYLMEGFGFPDRRGEPGKLRVILKVALPDSDDPVIKFILRDLEKQLLMRQDRAFVESRKFRDTLLLYQVPSKSKKSDDDAD